jgi:phosphoglycerate dehydrogenase-like enzyme
MPFDWLPDNVAFTNNSGTHYPRAVEYAAMSFLALNNKLPTVMTSQRNAQWNPVFSSVITGKTVLILGFGQIGQAAAEGARRFGIKVIGVRRSGAAHELADEMHPLSALPELLPRADFLLIATPSTPETQGIIGAAELDLLAPGAGIVNMGRASVMDYEALRARLNSGHIGGAILDVFDIEPLAPESPMWTTPNVIITPHNSTDDPAAYIPRSLDIFFRNVKRFAAGKELMNLVDRKLGY